MADPVDRAVDDLLVEDAGPTSGPRPSNGFTIARGVELVHVVGVLQPGSNGEGLPPPGNPVLVGAIERVGHDQAEDADDEAEGQRQQLLGRGRLDVMADRRLQEVLHAHQEGQIEHPPASSSTAKMISGMVIMRGLSWAWSYSSLSRGLPEKTRKSMRKL